MNTLPTPEHPHRHAMIVPAMPIMTDTGMMQIEKPQLVPRTALTDHAEELVETVRELVEVALNATGYWIPEGYHPDRVKANHAIAHAEQLLKEITK